MKLTKSFLLATLLISSSANAAVINGLDWLELSATGSDALGSESYNNTLTPGLIGQGWDYATQAQVEGLYSTMFSSGVNNTTAAQFMTTLGVSTTGSGSDLYSRGLYMADNSELHLMGVQTSDGTNYLVFAPGTNSYGADTSYTFGTYLVRPVPVPAAAWLFGSAVLGLAAVKRRKV
jgi:hypothetical protein